MKQFNLSEYKRKIERGETPKIVTKERRNVRILCTDRRGDFPIVGIVESEEHDDVFTFQDDGRSHSGRGCTPAPYDLFFADDEKNSLHEFKPFDKVLVRRASPNNIWQPDIFCMYNNTNKNYPYMTMCGCSWTECIPYEGNEELVGTTNNPKTK